MEIVVTRRPYRIVIYNYYLSKQKTNNQCVVVSWLHITYISIIGQELLTVWTLFKIFLLHVWVRIFVCPDFFITFINNLEPCGVGGTHAKIERSFFNSPLREPVYTASEFFIVFRRSDSTDNKKIKWVTKKGKVPPPVARGLLACT